ncbi:CopG family antitoxin [Comamonas sp. 23]|uniref:CopG family antitoxin n=1 Tax=Comamonas sp. 23 TaxID=3415008 RepID=UPI003C6F1F67
MNVTARPSAAAFIGGGPDSKHTEESEEIKQITLKLPVRLLEQIDTSAKSKNISRAAYIKMVMSEAVQK